MYVPGWNRILGIAALALAMPHGAAQVEPGSQGEPANTEQRPKRDPNRRVQATDEDESSAKVELRFRDLQTFEELVTDLIRPTELGALRLGKILPYPVTSLRFDALTIFPYVEQEFIYDSNVFLSLDPAVTKDSVISRTTLGGVGLVEFADGDGRFDFGWVSGINEFLKNSADFIEHGANTNLSYRANQVQVAAGLKWEERFNPVRIDVPGQRERDILTLYTKGTVDLADNLIFEAGWIWQNTEFEQALDAFLDSEQSTLYATLGYRLGEGKRVFVEYAHLTQVYFEPFTAGVPSLNDGHGNRVSVGAELTSSEGDEKTWSVVGSLGAQWVDYESDKNPAGGAAGFDTNDQESDVIANLRGEVLLTDTTTLSGSYRHLFAPSSVANFQIIDRFDVRVDHTVNPALRLRAGFYYEAADPSIRAPQGRKLDRFGVGVGARYQFDQFVNVGIDYEYRERNAPAVVGDYDVHRVALSLSIWL